MPTPTLVISLLCHNRLELTRRCLAKLDANTPAPHRLYITDNASTDGTRAFLETWASTRPHVRLIHNAENVGYQPAHRATFDAEAFSPSPPAYFAILNNDMELGPGWWERALAAFQANPKLALVGNSTGACTQLHPNFHGYPAPASAPPEYVEGSMLIARVSLVAPLGLFDPHLQFIYGEDSDLSLRVREAGHSIAVLDLNSRHLSGQTVRFLDPETKAKIARCQEANHQWLVKRWAPYLRRRNFNYQVLLTRRHALGDVIDVTPIIEALKAKWPACDVYVHTDFPEVFAHNPNVRSAARTPFRNPDYHFDLNLAYERRPMEHTLKAYADVAQVRCPIATALPKLYPSAADVRNAAKLLPDGPRYAILHPGPTGWPGKDWPMDRWRQLTAHLKASGYRTVVVGLGAAIPDASIDLRGRTTIPLLCAVMARASLFVGLDSGPSHVAQAALLPSVVLFGTVLAHLKLYPAAPVLAVQADPSLVPCVGEHHRLPPPIEHSACGGDCMRAITLDQVKQAVAFLAKRHARASITQSP